MSPWDTPYTKKGDFFNERILINGRRRLSKHAPRHLPPIFFFNRARFRRERADLVPFIWVLYKENGLFSHYALKWPHSSQHRKTVLHCLSTIERLQ